MRELPSSSREAKNHPKKCDPQERFLIHLAKSRLQLCAIARSAGPASIILQTTKSVWPKMRWNVTGRDRNFVYQIALQGVKHNIPEIWMRCVDQLRHHVVYGLRPVVRPCRCCYLLSLKRH